MQGFNLLKSIARLPRTSFGGFNLVQRSFAAVDSPLTALPADISTLITPKKVLVFSKKSCPYCEATKDFFDERDVDYEVIMTDKLGITNEHKDQLFKLTGGKTFPRIFIGQTSVGGFTDMIRLSDKGTLKDVFAKEEIEYNAE